MLGVGAAMGETAVVIWTASQVGTISFLNGWGILHSQIPLLTTWIYGAHTWVVTGGMSTAVSMSWEAENITFAGALVLVTMFLIVTVGALLLRNYLAKKTGAM